MINVKAFDNVLSKIIKAEAGIRKVILVDRTGLTIAHVSKFSYFPIDVDGVGAIASAVFVKPNDFPEPGPPNIRIVCLSLELAC